MIAKLRRRLTLLVIAVLALVTAGIVLSIHLINLRSIDADAASALQILTENGVSRPGLSRDGSGDRPAEGMHSRHGDSQAPSGPPVMTALAPTENSLVLR